MEVICSMLDPSRWRSMSTNPPQAHPPQELCSYFLGVSAVLMVNIRTEATSFHAEQYLNETE